MQFKQSNTQIKQKLKKILNDDDVFKGFNDQSKEKFLAQCSVHRYLPEQIILHQKQHTNQLFILISGTIQTGWLQTNGQIRIHQYLTDSTAFNLAALIQNEPMSFDYFAADRVEIAAIDGSLFVSELQQQPEALWEMLNLMTKRMYRLFKQNHYLKTANLKQKITNHFKIIIESSIPTANNHCSIPFKLSQNEFANMFNVSRQTLNKQLKDLQNEGILEWKYHDIQIFDIKKLKAMSELD